MFFLFSGQDGDTVLMMPVFGGGHAEVCRLLLEHGADANLVILLLCWYISIYVDLLGFVSG